MLRYRYIAVLESLFNSISALVDRQAQINSAFFVSKLQFAVKDFRQYLNINAAVDRAFHG